MLPWFHRLLRRPYDRPLTSLVLLFLAWKVFLLGIALATPGPDYDTSTQLLLHGYGLQTRNVSSSAEAATWPVVSRLVTKLTRWDAIYFMSIGSRGHLYEQEWAFGWGWTELLFYLHSSEFQFFRSLLNTLITCSSLVEYSFFGNDVVDVAVVGMIISNSCHLLSVLVLERLVKSLDASEARERTAFIAAALQIFSPAGLFLSAPYAESLFALLSFLGHLCYAYSYHRADERRRITHDVWLLASGIFFGLATTVRSNGILFGVMFAYDAVVHGFAFVRSHPQLVNAWLYASTVSAVLLFMAVKADMLTHAPSAWPLRHWAVFAIFYLNLGLLSLRYLPFTPAPTPQPKLSQTRHLACTITAGLLLATCFAAPQYLAWLSYCGPGAALPPRPWCAARLPLVFSFAQAHYWGVGPFRYWRASNAPLFAVAAPTLAVLFGSAAVPLVRRLRARTAAAASETRAVELQARFALVQALLALLALTTFHVQIVGRIASGYPLWMGGVAAAMVRRGASKATRAVVRWVVMYAVVQGVLFAAFLPPA